MWVVGVVVALVVTVQTSLKTAPPRCTRLAFCLVVVVDTMIVGAVIVVVVVVVVETVVADKQLL